MGEFTVFRNDIYFLLCILFTKIVPSRLDTLVRWINKIMVVFFFSFLFFFLYFSFFIIIFSRFYFFCFIYLFDVMNGKGLIEGRSVLANDPYSLPGLFW